MNAHMKDDLLLMIPGPVPVAERILRAMAKPMIGHRGKEFGEVYRECREILASLFQTRNEIFILSGSGTSAMEAAIGNLLGPEDTLVAVENGKFGGRFREIGESYCQVEAVKFNWGSPIDLDVVEEALERVDAKAISIVHNETSTGIKNPAQEIGKLARKHDCIFIMDGVTSIGGDLVEVDRWGVDIAVVGSQKCIGAPPGLSAISVSEKAWDSLSEKRPYYLDLPSYRKSAAKNQTPYTPAIPLFYAFQEALRMIREEGLEERIRRHALLSQAVRSAIEALGLRMFPRLNSVSSYSNTVTAVEMPPEVTDEGLRGGMKKLGVQISGGQGELAGKIFRIGTMGNINHREILTTLQALELTLKKHGVIPSTGRGIEAATEVLEELN